MGEAKRGDFAARVAGAGLGLLIAVLIIFSARPAGSAALRAPASIGISVRTGGAVAAAPAAPKRLLVAPRMRPGQRASGRFRLVNQTGRRLEVGLRARPSSSGLEELVRVRLAVRKRRLADTTVNGLRQAPSEPVTLRPGQTARLRITASIERGADIGYAGRRLSLVLATVTPPRRTR